MKKSLVFGLLIVLPILISGCEKPVTRRASDDSPAEKANTDLEETLTEQSRSISDILLDEVTVSASSTMVDKTNVGFNYEASMVLDKDFSTAWCPEKPEGEFLTISMPLTNSGGLVGVMPGFARDEKIYFQNNRVKTAKIQYYKEGELVDESVINFEDDYRMQFIEIPKSTFDGMALKIEDIFAGSKYNDSCIAEVDFFSDYVKSKDAKLAMDYYINNKANDAVRPYDIVSTVTAVDERNGSGESCQEGYTPPSTKLGKYHDEDGLWISDDIYAIADINQFGRMGDKLDVKWYLSGKTLQMDENDELYEVRHDWRLIKTGEVTVSKDCKGNLYAYHIMSAKYISQNEAYLVSIPGGSMYGTYMAQFWHKGKMVGKAVFEGRAY